MGGSGCLMVLWFLLLCQGREFVKVVMYLVFGVLCRGRDECVKVVYNVR